MLVVGLGNRFRGDDGVGPAVIDRLGARGFETVEYDGDGAGLIGLWQGRDRVIVVDAAQSGAAPGTVQRFDAGTTTVPSGLFRYSSHLFGLAEAVETARTLGQLPRSLVIYAITGRDFALGDRFSPTVAGAVDQVVAWIAMEIMAADRGIP